MDLLLEYFNDMPSLHRSFLLVGGLAFFFILEGAFPLFPINYKRKEHSLLNIFFTATTVIVNFALAFILLWISNWVVEHNFGFLSFFETHIFFKILIGLMLMDLIGAYIPHWAEHQVKWMWQFHLIHHSDKHVDTTTANRHHPGESVIRFAFTFFAILIVGAPMWLVFLYQTSSLVFTQFNHCNIKMPLFLDNILKLVFCTPNMHRVHHHYKQPLSDSNYGNIFSFWDRIFRTYRVVDNATLIYGLDTHFDNIESSSIKTLLKAPFAPHRKVDK